MNLSPNDGKICSFDCLYCEAGFNAQGPGTTGFPKVEKVLSDLENKFVEMNGKGETLDVITFSGNGEPTLHPDFPEIIDGVLALRDKYVPSAAVSVLTNSTRLDDGKVVEALKKVENPILKLDSAIDSTIKLLDRPNSPAFTFANVKERLKEFGDKGIIQIMLLRGEAEGTTIDNTSPEEVAALIEALKEINPRAVMLYSIDRPTPYAALRRVEKADLQAVADEMTKAGIKNVTVS